MNAAMWFGHWKFILRASCKGLGHQTGYGGLWKLFEKPIVKCTWWLKSTKKHTFPSFTLQSLNTLENLSHKYFKNHMLRKEIRKKFVSFLKPFKVPSFSWCHFSRCTSSIWTWWSMAWFQFYSSSLSTSLSTPGLGKVVQTIFKNIGFPLQKTPKWQVVITMGEKKMPLALPHWIGELISQAKPLTQLAATVYRCARLLWAECWTNSFPSLYLPNSTVGVLLNYKILFYPQREFVLERCPTL